MKKIAKIIILILLTIFIFTACSLEKTMPEADKSLVDKSNDEKIQLSFRITWKSYSGRGETISKLVDKFNDEQDDYYVELVSGDEELESIRNSLSKNNNDIFVLPYRYVQILGQENLLKAINITTSDKSISDEITKLAKVDSKLYGLPWVSHSMALLYNKTLIEEASVNPDSITDRDSFVKALIKIENETSARGIGLVGRDHNDLSWMVNQFIYGSGGSLIENDKVTINSVSSYDAIDYYMNTLSKYAQETWKGDTGIEVMDYFRQEKIAFEIQGLWGVTDIWKNGGVFEVGILPLSRIGANAEVGPLMLSYATKLDSDKEKGVLDFMEFMLSKDSQEFIMNGEYSPEHDKFYPFRLPVREDIIESELFEPFKKFEVFIESYHFPSIDVPSPKWMIIKDEIYTQGLHSVCEGDLSIEDFLNMIESEGNNIYKEEK